MQVRAIVVGILLLVSTSCKRSGSDNASTAATSKPAPTFIGTSAGPATTANIGPAGGTLGSSDGRLAVSIPAGALTANTAVSIQPVVATEPGGVGSIYQISPDGYHFAQPVTLAWQLSDSELRGRPLSAVTIATKDANGHWISQPGVQRDPATKTVRVATLHFSPWWARLPDLTISPDHADVPVQGSVTLKVYRYNPAASSQDSELLAPPAPATQDTELLAPPAPASQDTELLAPPAPAGSDADLLAGPGVCNWQVNGTRPGNAVIGQITNDGPSQATYTAPAKVPQSNPVTVSCSRTETINGKAAKILATAYITVTEKKGGWTGSFEYTFTDAQNTDTPSGSTSSKEDRIATGNFTLQSDPSGLGMVGGQGSANLQLINKYGMKNPKCQTGGTKTLKGSLDLEARGVAGSGAGSLSLSAHGESLTGNDVFAENCSQKGSTRNTTWQNGGFNLSCEFVGVDYGKGGSYSSPATSDQGHGICQVKISPQ